MPQNEAYRRNVALLSTSRLISTVGSNVSYIALVAVVYTRSGQSGLWVAAALVVMFGVSAAVGPWAGLLGDRLDRRRLMIASDLCAAATFVVIAFSHSLIVLVAMAGLSALAESPFGPAAQALLVMVVPEDRRTWATATRASSASAGQLLGGMLGGFMIAVLGGTTSFLVNAASFVLSALLVSRIKGAWRAERMAGPTDRGVSEGFRLVLANPALELTLLATSVGLLGTGMVNVAEYPLLVKIGGGSEAYGIAVSGWALGGLVAGRIVRRQGDAYSERIRLIGACGLVAVAIGLCGVVPVAGVVVVLFSIGGFAAGTRGIAATLIFQRWAPDHARARAFAAMGTANIGAIGIAMTVSGLALATLTPAGVCVASGLVGLLALLIATRVPPRKRDTHRPDEAPAAAPARPRGSSLLAT